MEKKKNVYEIITEQIINSLEEGHIPWKKPWSGFEMLPKNLISNKYYSGLNFFLLQLAPFESSYYLTYNQIKNKGGQLKKGSKGLPITFFKMIERKDNIEEVVPLLRYYRVFNLDQVEGIEKPKEGEIKLNESFENIEKAKLMLKQIERNHAPIESFKSNRAFYNSLGDYIKIPTKAQYETEAEYYCTAFHEIIHSTGYQDRLNRKSLYKSQSFGDHSYSEEELVAELGAAYLCAMTGISNETLENSKAYIKGWIKVFKNDPKMIHRAAKEAQKAVDYLTGSVKFEEVA
jgi:antirestriction protein ArdC